MIFFGARCRLAPWLSVRLWYDGRTHELFLVPASNKGRGMCYPLCGVVHIKELLLLIGKSSPCSGGSGFRLSLS